MANRFWVGGGSANTWAATSNTNWATTSGGANNATVPGVSDVAIFDSNSGTGNSVISANITVQGVDCTGGTGNYAGTITHNTAVTLTINTGAASSLRFSSGMTYTPASTTSIVTFTNTTGTAQLTSAGKAFCAITLNGVGGTVQQQDDLSINSVQNSILTITNGVWDCNTHALTANLVSSNNSNTRTFTLGGTVSIGGTVGATSTLWNFATTTGLTFNKNSANIVILAAATSTPQNLTFAGGSLTYNNLTMNSTTNEYVLTVSGANTFSNFTINSGVSVEFVASPTTISNAFTWTGTQTRPIIVFAGTGSTATVSVSSGACTFTWGALSNIIGSGGATFTATNVFDGGNNTGWSITPPADGTSSGIAASVWRDTTAGDFTVSGSIGQSLFTGVAPGGTNGLFIAGTNAATSVTTALTANITGNLSGSVGSVTGAVGSVTGNVGGNVTGSVGSVVGAVGSVTGNVGGNVAGSVASVTGNVGGNVVGSVSSVTGNVGGNVVGSVASVTGAVGSVTGAVGSVTGNVGGNVVGSVASVVGAVGSVTARVTANSDQIAGNATSATNLSLSTLVIGSGTVGSGSTTTSIVTSSFSFAGKSGPRAIVFRTNTTTTNLQGQGVAITSSTGGATPTFTVATLTDAPVSGDTFLVL